MNARIDDSVEVGLRAACRVGRTCFVALATVAVVGVAACAPSGDGGPGSTAVGAGQAPDGMPVSREEVFRPTSEEQDSKANSDTVPDAYAVTGQFERIVIARVKHRVDLLQGLERVVADEGIENAVILTGAGSVRNYHIHMVNNREFPSRNVYLKDPDSPADIVSMNGYVIGGRVHAHITLAEEARAFGGHLEPDTNVFTFAVVTLGVLSDDLDLATLDDKTYR